HRKAPVVPEPRSSNQAEPEALVPPRELFHPEGAPVRRASPERVDAAGPSRRPQEAGLRLAGRNGWGRQRAGRRPWKPSLARRPRGAGGGGGASPCRRKRRGPPTGGPWALETKRRGSARHSAPGGSTLIGV